MFNADALYAVGGPVSVKQAGLMITNLLCGFGEKDHDTMLRRLAGISGRVRSTRDQEHARSMCMSVNLSTLELIPHIKTNITLN